MSQSAITIAFENYLTQQVASGGTVTLDQFIFANVPDLDPNTPVDRSEQIPVDYIVYQQAVTLPGVINNNEVVYSVTMGTEVGDFDFNWIGLVNSSTSLLGMVTHAPVQQKFKNADGQQGNTLTRSFLMEYDGAATATAITTPAETWQIDFTARLAGMDERQRLENMDIYGYGAFFGDGYLVWGNPTDGYTIDAGVGYVNGLRMQLDADQLLNVTEKPINVYVDACWKGTLTSTWYVEQQITLASDLSNYTDPDGTAHYVFAVASIDVNGAVTDLRPSGSKDNQALSGYLQIANNLSEIKAGGVAAQQVARDSIGCGTAAPATVTTSAHDSTDGHLLKVGDFSLGKTSLNFITELDFNTYPFACGEIVYIELASAINVPDFLQEYGNVYLNAVTLGTQDFLSDNCNLLFTTRLGTVRVMAERRYDDVSLVYNWSYLDLNNLFSKSGGTLNGPVTIDSDNVPLAIRNKTQNSQLRLVGENSDGSSRWYLGNGIAGDDTFHLVNLLNGAGITVNADGSISILAQNNFLLDIQAKAEAQYFEATQNPGAGSFASQYNVKAPYYKEFSDSGPSVYHPLWKMKALTNKVMWSGGILIAEGSFEIQYINEGGGTVTYKFSKDGTLIPGSYANFDARYISGFRMANYGSYGSDGIRDSSHKLMTGIYATNGWDNPSTQEARTPQYCINGSWYDVAYV